MKKLIPLLACACALAFTPALPLAAQETGRPHGDRKDTPLGKEMKQMNRPFRALGRQITDASKNADSLQLVATMREAAEASLQYQPEKTADLPAADQAKFVADFHAGIKNLIADLDKLSAALKANDNGAAAAILQQIKDDQKHGHKEFKKPHPKE
jgi:soluble cytochrome b562